MEINGELDLIILMLRAWVGFQGRLGVQQACFKPSEYGSSGRTSTGNQVLERTNFKHIPDY